MPRLIPGPVCSCCQIKIAGPGISGKAHACAPAGPFVRGPPEGGKRQASSSKRQASSNKLVDKRQALCYN